MYKNIYLISIFLFLNILPTTSISQTIYSLDQALSDAVRSAPASLQYDFVKKENVLKLKNLTSRYFPQVAINGQATYQSETTGLDISLPGFSVPRLSQDQYKIQLDVNQFIYDGGTTAIQKNLADVGSEIENAQIDLDIEQLKEQIIHIYFGVLECEARLEIIGIKKNDLEAVMKKVETGVNSGAVLSSELKNIKVEMLGLDQLEDELLALKEGQIKVLNILTGRNPDNRFTFDVPMAIKKTELNIASRPMYRLLTWQKELADQSKKLSFSLSKPRIMFFAQGGYGKPGLNFLKNEFTPYYIAGVRLQWNMADLYTKGRDNQISMLQMQKIDAKTKSFNQQVEVKLATLQTEIGRSFAQMNADDEIINLRKEIKNTARIQLEKGTRTSSDYLMILNDESEAFINKKIHELQYIKAGYLYHHFAGDKR